MSDEAGAPENPVGRCELRSPPPAWVSVIVLVVGDVVVLSAMLALGIIFRQWLGRWLPIEISGTMMLGLFLATLCLPLGYAAAQLYPGYGQSPVERLRARVMVTLSGFGAMILFDHLAQDGQWSRGVLLGVVLLSVVIIPLWDRVAVDVMVRRHLWGEGVLVAGSPGRRRRLVAILNAQPELGWVPAREAEIEDAPTSREKAIAVAFVVLPPNILGTDLNVEDFPFRQVILVPEVEGVQGHWVRALALGSSLGLQIQRNLLVRRNRLLKRAFDVVVAALLLTLTVPAMALAAAAVRAVSVGPVLFVQERIGFRGKAFRMWKLRTMRADAEDTLAQVIEADPQVNAHWQHSMKIAWDPRVVPVVGRFLRRFSIDELPQFWNVLRGEMSLVGPRPLPDYHLRRLSPLAIHLRQQVLPGITGLWQISGRSETGLEEQERLDVYYVRNWSLWLDIHILSRTLSAVLGGRGAE
ncbi:MAG: exopolysaccharide biosynthesis polyprenyl glycosylphosphotransferase [Alphaproteobacteria bacterium]